MKDFCCIVKTSEGHFLKAVCEGAGPWNIAGWKSETDGIRFFEDAYARFHRRGHEASMSAAINNITFQPSIVALDIEEIKILIGEMRVVNVRNCSGSMDLIPLKEEQAKSFWEAGAKPRMVPS